MFFDNNKKNDITVRPQSSNAANLNILGKGTHVEGTINSDGDLRIDGSLKGNVIGNSKIVIGNSGCIEGEISCDSADISGHIIGKIIVKDIVILKSSAIIDGDIYTQKITMENGAQLNGRCTMGNNSALPLTEINEG